MRARTGNASSLRDEQLGQIFRNMRLTMKVSRETIARRLATSTASIDTFEAGAVGGVAPRQGDRAHRARLLRAAAVDPEPILWRIRGHMQTLASQPATSMPTTAPPSVAVPATVGRPATRSQTVARSERTQGGRSKAERTQTSPGPPPAGSRPVCSERAGCAHRGPGLSGTCGAAADLSRRGPAARPGRGRRARRRGLRGAPRRTSPRGPEVDRGGRSALAQSRQIADKHPLAS